MQTCPPLALSNTQLPQAKEVTYLGVHLDRRLTWRRHLKAKKTQIKLKANNLYWLLNPRSPLSLDYKVLLYNSTIKQVWTNGSQLWGNACSSNIDIIQRAQSKILKTIAGAPWYVRNENIHRDLNVLYVKDARRLTRVCSRSRFKRNDLPAQQ